MKNIYLFGLLLSSFFVKAQIRLPKLISDGMILQRETPLKVWGWASANEKIKLYFDKQEWNTQADENGKWLILLKPHVAGGPYELILEASNSITIKDVLFGDVWLCSGQSNMELMMERVKDKYPAIIASAHNPQIRQFTVPDIYNFQHPKEDLEGGQWVSVNPKSIYSFSAVAYFFAHELYSKYNVPIGLINAALGGSPIEAWMSEEALKPFPIYQEESLKYRDKNLIEQVESNNRKINSDWHHLLNNTDEGLKAHWHSPKLNDQDWKTMTIPNYWSDVDSTIKTGSVWFRKSFDLKKELINQSARLFLGRIVDADSVFINGKFIGTTSYQYPPRKYIIPADILKETENIISVRVINSTGKGGFVPDKPYQIYFPNDTIALNGTWKYKVGTQILAITEQNTIRWKPIGLFNAMIAPLTNFAIKGTIWYQGESNTNKPSDYKDLFPALINDWRKQWKQGNFPFLYVQLANYLDSQKQPFISNWAVLRQAQLQALSQPNTGMVVATDLGEWNDIHPLNKQEIGKRLSLQAFKRACNDNSIVASGPIIESISRKNKKIIAKFSNVGSGLVALNNQELKHFALAGQDKKFVWAEAKIKDNRVIVWSKAIKKPLFVRYAWADNPEGANLYNGEKLPASPFEIELLK
jgi:sialate O-acetylesterase